MPDSLPPTVREPAPKKLSELYPKYFRQLPSGVDPAEIDTYAVNKMFPVDDPTGCIIHARKKLLIPGVRSGGKSMLQDITEARDTLNRFIALMASEQEPEKAGPRAASIWLIWCAKPEYTNTGPPDVPQDALVDVQMADGALHEGIPVSEIIWDSVSVPPQNVVVAWRYH